MGLGFTTSGTEPGGDTTAAATPTRASPRCTLAARANDSASGNSLSSGACPCRTALDASVHAGAFLNRLRNGVLAALIRPRSLSQQPASPRGHIAARQGGWDTWRAWLVRTITTPSHPAAHQRLRRSMSNGSWGPHNMALLPLQGAPYIKDRHQRVSLNGRQRLWRWTTQGLGLKDLWKRPPQEGLLSLQQLDEVRLFRRAS
jgi:hypothetical protein